MLRGNNGKLVWSGLAFEERTEKSAAGSPTVYCRTRGVGKLKLERAATSVRVGSQTDQSCSKSAVGKSKQSIAEGQAHHVGTSPQEDRGGTAGEVGEGEGCEEEGGLEPAEPAAYSSSTSKRY
jgi:hypothetical protein